MKINAAPYMSDKFIEISENVNFENQAYSRLLSDGETLEHSIAEAKALISSKINVKHTVVVGMGGSSLGVKAFSNLASVTNISFLDELSDYKADKVLSSLDLENTVFLIISKSGNTSETLVLFKYILSYFESNNVDCQSRIHTITAFKESNAIYKLSKEKSINCFDFPKDLSGRFSVFSFPGLLPLSLAGVDIKQITSALSSTLNDMTYIKQLSQALIESINNKDFGQNFWTYDGRLAYFRAWLRQLVSESLGKKSLQNSNYSLPPFIECRGSTDQHSYLQHVLALPKKSLNLIFEMSTDTEKGPLDQKQASEAQKLKEYFSKYEIRYVELKLSSQNISEIAMFFIVWMFSTQLVGEHYGLDVYKQENIDELKKMSLAKN